MIQLFSIYIWAILAGVVIAPALALLGCHLASRDRAMQTLCVGQGATLGVLVGIAIVHLPGTELESHGLGPFITAVLFAIGTFVLSESVWFKRQASKNSFYAGLFASLMAGGYLVCALFPSLENHMSQVFFGDLATLSNIESMAALILGVLLFFMVVRHWRGLTAQSFCEALFGAERPIGNRDVTPFFFHLISLIALCFSVQFLGFLFTVGLLFLPTVLMKSTRSLGVRGHFWGVGILAFFGSFGGFFISLWQSRLPTVPTIILSVLVLGAVVASVSSIILWLRREKGSFS